MRAGRRETPRASANHESDGFSPTVSGNRRGPLRTGDAWLAGVVPETGIGDADTGALSGGGKHPSGRRSADGGALGAAGRAAPVGGPPFDQAVPPGGYLWWYLDGLSGDGRHAITLIVFVGSVFSPYYAWAGYRDPLDHCSLNVALYGPDGGHWAMTERGRRAVERSPDSLRIGPSSVRWDHGSLLIDIEERTTPWFRRLSGTIRVTPGDTPGRCFALDRQGRHLWQPIAPHAEIEVTLDKPALRWRGTGYLDSNHGAEPLQEGFRRWTWSRAHLSGRTVVLYDVACRDGSAHSLALSLGGSHGVEALDVLPETALPLTGWRLARPTRADKGVPPAVIRTLEDGPFYARSLVRAGLYGEPAEAFHESLNLDRFRLPLVRAMLPFRMPRRG
jgi:carotenoid 1,2-hydratase